MNDDSENKPPEWQRVRILYNGIGYECVTDSDQIWWAWFDDMMRRILLHPMSVATELRMIPDFRPHL